MRRPPLPSLVGDLLVDRRAANALLASVVALFAAGMDPKVMAPMATTTQAAIRAQPGLEGLVLLVSVVTAVLILLGGAVGDLTRARPVVIGGLAASLVAAIVALPLIGLEWALPFQVVRLVGIGSAAIVMPAGLAMAATSYTGVPRATAIGIAYAGYGAGQALSPTLVSLIPGNPVPAFAGAIAASGLALVVVRGRIPMLDRASRPERPLVLGTALWACGVVLLTTGLLWFGGGLDNPLRILLVAGGIVLVVAFLAWQRVRHAEDAAATPVERRPVTIALFVGLVIAMAQTAPMSQLPLFFSIVMRYGPLLGMAAVAPLFVGLVAAGPVAGYLLARYQPRDLIAGGVLAVGLGDIAVAAVLGQATPYPLFILPLLLVGAGFVVATTVRTAIIFASVPRGLPATAAALNEASIEVGTRAGIVVITAVLATVAVSAYTGSLAGQPEADVTAAASAFREVLGALGLPSWPAVMRAVQPDDLRAYGEAYITAIRVVMLGGGLIGVAGAVIAWLALGRRDPLTTVYEHRDERVAA